MKKFLEFTAMAISVIALTVSLMVGCTNEYAGKPYDQYTHGAYNLGMQAAEAGLTAESNPYKTHDYSVAWFKGYLSVKQKKGGVSK